MTLDVKLRLLLVLALACLAPACTSDPDMPPSPPSPLPGTPGGGGQVSTGGGAGTASVGAGGIATAGSSNGGAAGGALGTSGGSSNTAGSGTAGAGGSSASLTMGTQTDPGTLDDGTFPQPPPYEMPPESLSLRNGAPKGAVTGPFLHTQTGTYTDWQQWKFTYYVYVPSQYKAGHAAALMVFNDGYLYAGIPSLTDSRFNAPTVFDNLIHEGTMPVTIAVFIFPGTNDGHQVGGGDGGRAIQYDSPNDQYGKFLIQEFLPTNILSKYDIVTDPDGWGIGGHSSGGIASIIAGWYWPDKFHKILTASPSFPNRGNKFPDEFLTSPTPKPLRIYHLAGTKDLNNFKAQNDEAAQVFQMLGYHYRYRPGEDAHYPPKAAMADFPSALRWLWRGYKAVP